MEVTYMDPHLIFWIYAYVLMFVVLIFAFRGVKFARKGQLEAHRTAMVWACNLLLFFVLSYVGKVFGLGREDKSAWTAIQLTILYIHEAMILLMLITGTTARIQASKFKDSLLNPNPGEEDMALRRKHAKWGKAAIVFATSAFLTATGVMWALFSVYG